MTDFILVYILFTPRAIPVYAEQYKTKIECVTQLNAIKADPSIQYSPVCIPLMEKQPKTK